MDVQDLHIVLGSLLQSSDSAVMYLALLYTVYRVFTHMNINGI